ncbi:hypothetical protein [Bradyrhizobium genosp. L]|uniref:hypothetical protein n=1 Tax=Bradyrhizobium genosp. L TaxID=83637 RepID=UPI001FEDDE8D|nr:hypothetical protein [Bradyrhizobium genosp. L]
MLDLFREDLPPKGLRFQPDFLSSGEEQALQRSLEVLPFKELKQDFTGKRRVASFGWRYDFNGGGLSNMNTIPDFLSNIRARTETFAAIPKGSSNRLS